MTLLDPHVAFAERAPMALDESSPLLAELRRVADDPTIVVFVDLRAHAGEQIEVWARDYRGEPYLILCRGYLDNRLVDDVVRADNRRADALARVAAAAEAKARADATARAEHTEEVADKLQWALRRDQGQHYGGSTRTNLLSGERRDRRAG